MKLSISNIAWETNLDEDVALLLAKHNVHYIDIAPGKYFADFKTVTDQEIKAVKNAWTDRGIHICGIQALLFGTSGLNLFNQNCQTFMLEHLARACHIGAVLNATKLVYGTPRNRDKSVVPQEAVEDIALDFFCRLGDIAAAEGVEICLEANPTCYGANWLTTTFECIDFLQKLNHKSVGMQLDFGTVYINGEPFDEIVAQGGKYVTHIHLSERQMGLVTSRDAEHQKVGAIFKKAVKDKVFPTNIATIEMLTPAPDDKKSTLQAIDDSILCVRSIYGVDES